MLAGTFCPFTYKVGLYYRNNVGPLGFVVLHITNAIKSRDNMQGAGVCISSATVPLYPRL